MAVNFGAQSRALFATDASNYRQVPIGVVTPRSRDEVIETVRHCRKHDAPIFSRGGGTSLAGPGCNVAVVIDFSRPLDRIMAPHPQERLSCVYLGCIFSPLPHSAGNPHFPFAPCPSSPPPPPPLASLC